MFSARAPEGLRQIKQSPGSDVKTIVCQLLQALAATLNTSQSLPQLTELLGSQLGAEACLLLRYHQGTDDFVYTSWHRQEAAQSRRLLSHSRSPQVALQRRVAMALIQQAMGPEVGPHPSHETIHWREGIGELLRTDQPSSEWLTDLRSFTVIPVDTAPDMAAVALLLSHQRPYPLALEPAERLTLASLLAVAFHQHHLQEQAQRSAEQLRYLTYLKEDFLSTLNHELRTPLTSMMLAIRMLRRPDLTSDRAAMYLDILDQQCSREISLVNDLLMLQTVDSRATQVTLVPTDLVQLLHTLAAEERPGLTAAHLELVLDLPTQAVIVATSTDHLTRALQELLTNARKYSYSHSTITLTLTDNLATNQSVTLRLSNTGAGIRADDLPHIFEKFRRGQESTRNAIPGTGTGLALARGLIEQLNGKISVTSQRDGDQLWRTCFIIELHPPAPSAQSS